MTTPKLELAEYPTGSLQPSAPYNDAMQVLDALVRPGGIIEDKDLTTPPTTVSGDVGKTWIIPSGATGAWSGRTGQIALCTAATVWRYFEPTEGWRAYILDENLDYIYSGSWGAATASVQHPVNALTNSSGTVTVDCSLGVDFTLTLAANVTTLSLTNLAGAGYATEIEIEIKQNGTGGFTFAIPAAFKALGGSDTAIASAPNAVTILSAKTFDNGTTWRYAMQESA